MSMKEHILASLREQFNSWEEVLASLSDDQIVTPRFDFDWSIKDVIAHLWAWQQISIARMEAAVQDREPEFPEWIVNSVEDWEENADKVNAVTFERQHNKPWNEIHQNWRGEFIRLLEVGDFSFGKKSPGRR